MPGLTCFPCPHAPGVEPLIVGIGITCNVDAIDPGLGDIGDAVVECRCVEISKTATVACHVVATPV